MNDWVNCLRFVAFGQAQTSQPSGGTAPSSSGQPLGVASAATPTSKGSTRAAGPQAVASSSSCMAAASAAINKRQQATGREHDNGRPAAGTVDVLLERRHQGSATGQQQVSALSSGGLAGEKPNDRLVMATRSIQTDPSPAAPPQPQVMTASQAAAAAASALAKTRQRQPSLLGSCKPQPPNDSPFIKEPQRADFLATGDGQRLVERASSVSNLNGGQGAASLDTLTPTVRGQLIAAGKQAGVMGNHSIPRNESQQRPPAVVAASKPQLQIQATLDEEEENMLYCSIEDNPSEHNYRVKVIETELALRCQLKCYQLTAPKTISQQYEELSQFRHNDSSQQQQQQQRQLQQAAESRDQLTPIVTFYQLIIGPQELTLLNDYATSYSATHKTKQQQQQQGLWSWPYQCIRRYGFDKDNCFMFEAGRKCTSGPGQFIVQTPKAYNIYQDVVKFVNELRTISGGGCVGSGVQNQTSCSSAMAAAPTIPFNGVNPSSLQAPATGESPRQVVQVVTQIPVTWTPSNQANCAAGDGGGIDGDAQPLTMTQAAQHFAAPSAAPAESRKQFFEQLTRKMETTSVAPNTTLSVTNPAAGVQTAATTPATAVAMPTMVIDTNQLATCHASSAAQEPVTVTAGGKPRVAATGSESHDQHPLGAVAPLATTPTTTVAVRQLDCRASPSSLSPGSASGRMAPASRPTNCPDQKGVKAAATTTTTTSSRLSSSASEETDESGYEQGDESVESGPTKRPMTRQQVPAEPTNQRPSSAGRLTVQAPNSCPASSVSSSSSSSSSSASASSSLSSGSSPTSSTPSSAGTSPGQSVSRRTGETIQQEAAARQQGGQSQLLIDTRLSLNKVDASKRQIAAKSDQTNPEANGNKSRNIRDIIVADVLNDHVDSQPVDFETSLIRDVYSEITKLHAKFAVTSTSSGGDDSMSSDSRGSSSDRISRGDEDDEEEEDDDDDDDDEEEESNCADDGCYYMNEDSISDEEEPMYSNLRPMNRTGPRDRDFAKQPTGGGSTSHRRPQHSTHQISAPNSRSALNQQQHQLHHNNHPQANLIMNYEHSLVHANPPLSPHSMRPIYPTILNPIPEINETSANPSPRQGGARRELKGSDTSRGQPQPPPGERRDPSTPRTRLTMNREAIKRQQQPVINSHKAPKNTSAQPQTRAPSDRSKSTNHYVINDVQYAKISRNLIANTKFR